MKLKSFFSNLLEVAAAGQSTATPTYSDLDDECRGLLLGQCFMSSGRGRDLLQDEDHSGSRPHSFPGYYLMRSG